MHWAAQYIGKVWKLEGDMQSTFSCFQLCCVVQRNHFGRDMPSIVLNTDPSEAIKKSSWRVSEHPPVSGDVLSMQSTDGPHVGTVIDVDGQLMLLHAVGSVKVPGTVIATALNDLQYTGFQRIRTWKYNNEQ